MPTVILPGSRRRQLAGAYMVGDRPAEERVEVTIVLRRRQPLRGAGQARFADRGEFAAAHGADPADIASIEQFARQQDLAVVQKDAAPDRAVIGHGGKLGPGLRGPLGPL